MEGRTTVRFLRRTPETDLRDRFISTARAHVGYRCRPGGLSEFGAQTGYQGHDIPWDGSFVDVVARTAGVQMPACVYTPSGLAEFAYSRRVHFQPAPGDIVFYSFPAIGTFGAPHCGIVTGLGEDFVQTGRFFAIEAQVSSGLFRDNQYSNGVHERSRWIHETIAFGRPDFKPRPGREVGVQTGNVFVRLSRARSGRRNSDIQAIQDALVLVAGLGAHTRGSWDQPSREAYARWQRMIGFVGSDATGQPDPSSLARLGRESGVFKVHSEN
jgi:hypothetical protein